MYWNKYADVGWILAIRKRSGFPNLFDGNFKNKFTLIKNPWRYWCADPFLFYHKGTEYIFCEAYDILRDKGVIAYRTVNNTKVSKLKVCLECKYHLSYPYVFKYNNEIYMVPETCEVDRIELYKAVQFPDKWEKCCDLLKNVTACDTNFFTKNSINYMFTLIFDKSKSKYEYDKLYMYYWNGKEFELSRNNPVTVGSDIARNAGRMFLKDNTIYRVSQNCSDSYGESINFFAIKELELNRYSEELIQKVYAKDIRTEIKDFDGIHTYNFSETYEIIDLKKEKWFRAARMLYLIKHKLSKLIKTARAIKGALRKNVG